MKNFNEMSNIILGEGISFEQEMEKQAEWAAQACLANQPISPFPPFLFKAVLEE